MEYRAHSARQVIPSKFEGSAEHLSIVGNGEFIRVNEGLGYSGDPEIIAALQKDGLLLEETGSKKNQKDFMLPEHTQSLSGILNATSIDQRSEEKRQIVFNKIRNSLAHLASKEVSVTKGSAFSRHDFCFDGSLNLILMPLGLNFRHTDITVAHQVNTQAYIDLLEDIIQSAAPDDVEFFQFLLLQEKGE